MLLTSSQRHTLFSFLITNNNLHTCEASVRCVKLCSAEVAPAVKFRVAVV